MKKYDKVLYHPKRSVPVDLEADNRLFVVPIVDVCAVFRRSTEPVGSGDAEIEDAATDDPAEDDPVPDHPADGDAAGAT